MNSQIRYDQYFLSYSSVRLPLNLVSPITPESIPNRNTYFGANLENGRICLIHKRVYGDIELSHRYQYYPDGTLKTAEIQTIDDECIKLTFDTNGKVIDQEEITLE